MKKYYDGMNIPPVFTFVSRKRKWKHDEKYCGERTSSIKQKLSSFYFFIILQIKKQLFSKIAHLFLLSKNYRDL
jgi:hypothetical protein